METFQVPPEWADYGARWGNDGLLYLAEWRKGFTVHELRALFFTCQERRSLEAKVSQLERERDAANDRADAAERRAWWLRSQLTAESRLGLAFAQLYTQR